MRRIDRVLDYVEKLSRQAPEGVTADEVAEGLGIARPNASADLNSLWKQGELLKGEGRPVRYRPSRIGEVRGARPHTEEDPLKGMVGWKESLAAAVKQAKAAILYPGGGLHTLVSGATGVGKSRLAELMFQFGTRSGVFRPGSQVLADVQRH